MAGHSAHYWAHYWALLGAPDLFGGLHHEAQLSDLLIPGQRIAVQGGGEAALRGQAQLVDVHELAGLLDPALDVVLGFQLSPLTGHQTEDDVLALRHETQRREPAGALVVEIHEEDVNGK